MASDPKRRKGESSPTVAELTAHVESLQEIIARKLQQGDAAKQQQAARKLQQENSQQGELPKQQVFEAALSESESGSDIEDDDDKENFDSVNRPAQETLEGTVPEYEGPHFVELDQETLEILSDDENAGKANKFLFHPKLAATWQRILSDGLKKEKKAELLNNYPRAGNCPIQTPKLNTEIEVSLNETSKKRDKFFVADLDLCGASLSALGTGISMIFNSSEEQVDTKALLKSLVDAGKLMCELHNQLIKARKSFIYPSMDKKARAILEKSESGEFLFGLELSQRIKSAKAVEKLGLSLKPVVSEKKPVFRAGANLNWGGPSATPRQGQAGQGNMNYSRNMSTFRGRGRNRQSNQTNQNRSVTGQQPQTQGSAGPKK